MTGLDMAALWIWVVVLTVICLRLIYLVHELQKVCGVVK